MPNTLKSLSGHIGESKIKSWLNCVKQRGWLFQKKGSAEEKVLYIEYEIVLTELTEKVISATA